MSNPLQILSGPPPAPNMDASNPLQQPGSPMAQGGAPGMAMPSPSRDQVIAAMVHFGAIQQKLDGILAEPDLGKSDMRQQIREAVIDLVSDRIMSAGTAVSTLTTVPDGSKAGGPLEQRKWVEQHDAQNKAARDAVLDHYRVANQGIEGAVNATPPMKYDRNKHIAHVDGLISHYRELKRA